MSLTLNSRQVPDHSIMDKYGKQTYLGQGFIGSSGPVTSSAGVETPILYLLNPASNSVPVNYTQSIGAFMQGIHMSNLSAANVVFKLYINPSSVIPGPIVTPLNLRPADNTTSRMTLSELVSAGTTNQTTEITTVANQSPPVHLNNTWFRLYGVGTDGVSVPFYVWFNVDGSGTNPNIVGATGVEVDIATNASAVQVASSLAAALQAYRLAGQQQWVTSFDGTSTITVTNYLPGETVNPSDGTSGFTFNVTAEGNFAFGTLVRTYSLNASFKLDDLLVVLDPGNSLMVTTTATGAPASVEVSFSWYEL